MTATAADAIAYPHSLISAEWASSSDLDSFPSRIATTFSSLFTDVTTLQQASALTSLTTAKSSSLPLGKLVRFRAMVQDAGLGTEVYQAVGSKDQPLGYGIEEEVSNGSEDYSKLRERQILYLVSVPGETDWVKESLDQATAADLQATIEALTLSNTAEAARTFSPLLANKQPNPAEPSFGCIAKTYGDNVDQFKPTEVLEFVGILTETSYSSSFDELSSGSSETPPTITVPALHILFTLPASTPSAPFPPAQIEEVVDLRRALIGYFTSALGGDADAAEWLLIALLAKIHTRHPTGLQLGSLSLNLSLPTSSDATLKELNLHSLLSPLLPTVSKIDLSIPFLNSSTTRIAPRNVDENLQSGLLQLSSGTRVVVDTRGVGEGKLEDTGVKNLRYLATTIAQQKLAYQYPFSAFELDTDLGFVVLSEGKAIIPTDCVVYVQPEAEGDRIVAPSPSPEQVTAFRSFIATMREADFTIPPEMSEIIQNDFVKRRQDSFGGEAMTQEDLLFRMGAARLLTLSHGETSLSEKRWLELAELDERRKERFPSATRAEQSGSGTSQDVLGL